MDIVNTLKLSDVGYPKILRDIASPPKQLFYIGSNPDSWLDMPRVAVVGSRKISSYGQVVTASIVSDLARAGVVIISGLAFGVDTKAHQTALEANGITIAVLGTPVDSIYPSVNRGLARRILYSGGTVLSEYSSGTRVYLSNFVARNRIVSGLADVLLITEAALKSGSLHTARFALEQGKTVMAVPANINSPSSEGCNNLIKSGAVPVTSADDIFFALGINPKKTESKTTFNGSTDEKMILDLIRQGINMQEELVLASRMDSSNLSSTLTMLELNGLVRPLGGGSWTVV